MSQCYLVFETQTPAESRSARNKADQVTSRKSDSLFVVHGTVAFKRKKKRRKNRKKEKKKKNEAG